MTLIYDTVVLTGIRLNLTLGTKTLHAARILDIAIISISKHFKEFSHCGDIAVPDTPT
jgi:hypothetical protein